MTITEIMKRDRCSYRDAMDKLTAYQSNQAMRLATGLEKGNRPDGLAKEALMPTIEALAHAWRERAQKCRDEAHDQIDWENPGTAANRLLIVAKQLDDCARELEITIRQL